MPRFGEYLALSIADLNSDLDKDGQVSLLEAFLVASNKTAEFYKTKARLATEHPLIDDNGDHAGTPSDWFRGVRAVKRAKDGAKPDGARAHQFCLVLSERDQKLSLESRLQRDKLEQAVADLRDKKDKLKEDDYYNQLEDLMIKIAKLSLHAEESSEAKDNQ